MPDSSDPAKRHSAALTDGPDRAGARAMLKAIGFTDEDLAKPLVGVATTWIETMPCNYNQRRLAEFVKEGIRAAGGTPMEFNTIAVSDGVTMGTEGMKASLVSREVVADSIELVVRGHLLDGARLPRRLRQDDAGRGDGARPPRRARASSSTTARSIPGVYKGGATRRSSPSTRRSGRTGPARSRSTSCTRSRTRPVPGAGACGGQYTANTMSTVMEFIGLSPAGLNGIPAEDPAKDEAARATGRAGHGPRPARRPAVVDRHPGGARERRSPSVAATGGSTNGVLHLLAIAHEFGIPLDIDEFGAIADRTPIVADMQPGGRYTASDMYDAGGVGLVMRELLKRGPAPRRRADGRRPDDRRDRRATRRRPPGQQVVVPIETPLKPTGGLAILRGSLAPDGCVVKLAGHERRAPPRPGPRLRLGGGLLRGRPGPADQARRRRRHPLRGPGRRPGHAGDAAASPRRSSARAWATRSRSSPTAASPAAPTA